jgi:hypothetical protein
MEGMIMIMMMLDKDHVGWGRVCEFGSGNLMGCDMK